MQISKITIIFFAAFVVSGCVADGEDQFDSTATLLSEEIDGAGAPVLATPMGITVTVRRVSGMMSW